MHWVVKHAEKITILFLFIFTVFLRFTYLSYSDYISDEPGTFLYRDNPSAYDMTPVEYLLNQRKGPMQIFIGFIPYLIVGNYRNELAQRIPFSVFNTASVIVLYFLIKRLTNSKLIGFVAASLFCVNGFVTAFGRVAQYQSLNMFFSFFALYFYSFLLTSKKNLIKYTLFGTIMYSCSILSHWDAIYVLPVILFIFLRFLKNSHFSSRFKIKLFLINLLLGCLILLPFLIPYIYNYYASDSNSAYFARRVGIRETFDSKRDIFRFKLYNPFVAFELYVGGVIIGILFDAFNFLFKKDKSLGYGSFTLWFLFCFVIFRFFIRHSGTHIYNLTLPALVLTALAIGNVFKLFPKYTKTIPGILVLALIGFLYYQSYVIFVDHSIEYPWSREVIAGYKTPKYTHEDNIRHLIGFPLKRNWKEINDYVNMQNKIRNEEFSYITNEDKGLSGFYMDVAYRKLDGFYAVGIRRPLSFVNDYKFSQIHGKQTVHKININGENLVRIYRVEEEED